MQFGQLLHLIYSIVLFSAKFFFILKNSSYKKQFIKTLNLLYTLFSLFGHFYYPL